MDLILIIIVLLLFGGGGGYAAFGLSGGLGLAGLLLIVLGVYLLVRRGRF